MHCGALSSIALPVAGGEEYLGDNVEELLWLHVWPPHGLAGAHELYNGVALGRKVLHGLAGADAISGEEVRLALLVEAGNKRADVVTTEALAVQEGLEDVAKDGSGHEALFSKRVHL